MRLLTLGSARKLFEEGSKVSLRLEEQSSLFEKHTIIVFTRRSSGFKPREEGNLRIVPTHSISRLLYGFDAIRIGRREGRENTLVSSQDPFETGLAALVLSRLLKKPLHVQVHTDLFSPYFEYTLMNRVRRQIARFVIPRAACLRVVSVRIKRDIEKRYGPRTIAVLPVYEPFAGEETAGTGTFGFKKFFLVASRLEKEKNVALALRALARVVKTHKGVGLVVAGEGKERPYLERMARNLRLQDKVLFLGWRDDLPALLRSATAFVSTSLFEGYGVSLLMAARAGVPIITTDVGLIGDEIPKEAVTVIPHRDPRALARSMEDILLKEEEMQDRATRLRGRLAVSPVSKDMYAQKLLDSFTLCTKKK